MRISILLLTLIVFSCNQNPAPKLTPQKKAEQVVYEHIKANANDPASYEPLFFSRLDTNFQVVSDNSKASERADVMLSYIDAEKKHGKNYADSIEKRIIQLGNEAYKETNDGLKIYHRYRAKNGFGATMLTSGTFYLDTNFQITSYVSSDDSIEIEAKKISDRLQREADLLSNN